AQALRLAVQQNVARLETVGAEMMTAFRGERLQDIALNAVEIIDRNLYERSCDVRWWATDSAVVQALETPGPASASYAVERLATILRSYTVYLDLWVVDAQGRVVANGRPQAYPGVIGLDVSREAWFRDALATRDGDQYVVADVATAAALGGAPAATYATAIRQGAQTNGQALGALGIFFDWAPQAAAVVGGVGLSDEEKQHARVLLLDGASRVIAASDGVGVLTEVYDLKAASVARGFYVDGDRLVAYALTPGYETYRGLGWSGVIDYRLREGAGRSSDADAMRVRPPVSYESISGLARLAPEARPSAR
ncbi:MAG TPA: cache domain-containing protein, partial [Ktedonobacterales bacterium]|nr:cache domain-containing protein [Ktedonobacterales bacterium]